MNNVTMSAKRSSSRNRRSSRKERIYKKEKRTKLKRELLELMNRVIKGGKKSIEHIRKSGLPKEDETKTVDFIQELLDAILVKSVLIESDTVTIKNAKRVSELTQEVRELIHYMGDYTDMNASNKESNNSNIEGLIGAFKNVGMEDPSDYLGGLMSAFEKVKL